MTSRVSASQGDIASSGARKRLAPLAIITILSFCIPANFMLGSLFMTPSRLLFIFTVPYLLISWLSGKCGPKVTADWLVMFYVFWMTITIAYHHPSQSVTFVGTTSLIILGGYLTARLTIRSADDMFALVRFAAGVVLLMLPFALIESITTKMFIADFVRSLPVFESYKDADYCCRLGLDRAQVVFTHPIHFGIFASLPFALYVLGLTNHVPLGKRILVGAGIGIATFLSISSGPFLSLNFQGMLVLYTWATYKHPAQWRNLIIFTVISYTILELNTTHFGLFALASKLAFNSGTAYIRAILFEYGIDQVMRTPIFGLGYKRMPLPVFMTGSVDNFWLLLAVVHGLPAFLALFFAFIWSMIKAGGGRFVKGSDLYYLRVSWTFLLIGLTLSLATVAIWSEVHSMVMFMFGAGQFMMFAREPVPEAQNEATEDLPPKNRYTRFPKGAQTARSYRDRPLKPT